jgi:hypothetical protein
MKTFLLWIILAATCLAGYGGGTPPTSVHRPLAILHSEACGNWFAVAITGGTRPYQARLYASGVGEIGWWETSQSGFFFSALPDGGYAFVIADADGCCVGGTFEIKQ